MITMCDLLFSHDVAKILELHVTTVSIVVTLRKVAM